MLLASGLLLAMDVYLTAANAYLQVSHHPPVGAAHAENKDWEYDMVSAPTTKFLGNSIDIYPIGEDNGPSILPACLHHHPTL